MKQLLRNILAIIVELAIIFGRMYKAHIRIGGIKIGMAASIFCTFVEFVSIFCPKNLRHIYFVKYT